MADLVLGGNTYQPSVRVPARGIGVRVDPGLPQHGYWVFDVAPELIQPSIRKPLQLRVWSNGEERLNSRVVIDLDNWPLERDDIVTVKPYEIGPGGMNRLWVRNLIGIAVAAAALTTICVVELAPQWFALPTERGAAAGRVSRSECIGARADDGGWVRSAALPSCRNAPAGRQRFRRARR